MDNKKKIIFGVIAGIIFILAFILNLLFPPKPFVKSAHAAEGSLDNVIEYFLDHPDVPLSELVQDEEHYNYLKDYAASRFSVDLPSWESSGTNDDVYNFFRNIASGFIGQYAYPDQEVLTSLIGSVNDLNDFLELIEFDSETGEFIASPAGGSGIVDLVDHHIYVSSDPDSIGYWVRMSADTFLNLYYTYYGGGMGWKYSGTADTDVYLCAVSRGNGCYIVVSCLNPSFSFVTNNWGNSYNLASEYYYTVDDVTYTYFYREYYYAGLSSYPNHNGFTYLDDPFVYYNSINTALEELWGVPHDGDPVLTGAIIVNDNPIFTGISLPSAGVYDYSTTIVNNYDNDDDTPISYRIMNYQPYTYTYTIPYDNIEYELPIYPEIPHDLPEVTFNYPEITANEEIQEGMNGLNSLWVTLLTMGGSFIVLKVIL